MTVKDAGYARIAGASSGEKKDSSVLPMVNAILKHGLFGRKRNIHE